MAALLVFLLVLPRLSLAASIAGNSTPGTNTYPAGMMQVVNKYVPGDSKLEAFACTLVDASKGYVYFGTADIVTKVLKFRISDFSFAGELDLQDDGNSIYCGAIDSANGYAYFALMHQLYKGQPGAVVKVRLSDFTRVGKLVMADGNESRIISAVIDTSRGYAYFGTYTDPAKIIKVRLSDFTRVAAITLPAGEQLLYSATIDPVAGYAYFGTRTTPGIIVKIRLSDFTRVGSLTLNPDESGAVSALTDPAGGHAYFGLDTTPGEIVKVRLSDFKRVAALKLNADEKVARGCGIDPANGYAYFGTNNIHAMGGVVKIKLSDLTRVATLKLNPGEEGIFTGGIDPGSGALFLGAGFAPPMALKVGLSYKNSVHANHVYVPTRARVADMRFYAHASGNNLRLAIYNQSSPKKLLWQSASTKITTANAWCTIPISKGSPASLTLNPGSYWLAWQTDSSWKVPSATFDPRLPVDAEFILDSPYGSFPATVPDAKYRRYGMVSWSEYMTYAALNTAVDDWLVYD